MGVHYWRSCLKAIGPVRSGFGVAVDGPGMHVHANAAVSVDGKLATRERRQTRISGPADRARVDRLRAGVDAVLVGVGTVLADDPHLTVPEAAVEAGQPARVVLDSAGRVPLDARVLSDAAPSYVVVSGDAPEARREALAAAGATVVAVAGDGRVNVEMAVTRLASAGIDRLLVEGGGEVLYSFLRAELVDVLTLYVAPTVIGGREAPTLVDGEGFVDRFPSLELDAVERLDDGVLCTYAVAGWRDAPAG